VQTSMGLEDDAVVVDSDSDSDVDMDDDTVMVGAASSARVQPTDVGFSDFDDFGGFQAEAAHPTPEPPGASWRPPADPHVWNAFSDPTDAGRPSGAAFAIYVSGASCVTACIKFMSCVNKASLRVLGGLGWGI